MRARFTELARAEFLAEMAYYETLRKGLGARFREEVEAVAERVAAFPNSGTPAPAGTRKRLVPHFPFSILYTATTEEIVIHAVVHHRRMPEYWVARLAD